MKNSWRNCPTCRVEVRDKFSIIVRGYSYEEALIYQCLKCKEIFSKEELIKASEERRKNEKS